MIDVFNFPRVNNYIHGILKFIKDTILDYYDTLKGLKVKYYDKTNIKNAELIEIIDMLYGGDDWKCFTRYFVTGLENTIHTSINE